MRNKRMSGLFDFFKSSVPDLERGRVALRYFYDRAITYPHSNMPDTFEKFISMVNQKSPALVDGLGGTINSIDQDIGYSDSQVQEVMETLADRGEGNWPMNFGIFQQAVGKDASDPSFWSSIRFTAVETASDIKTGIATGIEEVGQGAISTLKLTSTLAKNLPIILGAGAVIIVGIYLAPLLKRR